jgi:hypothetical protein
VKIACTLGRQKSTATRLIESCDELAPGWRFRARTALDGLAGVDEGQVNKEAIQREGRHVGLTWAKDAIRATDRPDRLGLRSATP